MANIRYTTKSDLIEFGIPLYEDLIPNVAKPSLYKSKEVEWQQLNIPELDQGRNDHAICTAIEPNWSLQLY